MENNEKIAPLKVGEIFALPGFAFESGGHLEELDRNAIFPSYGTYDSSDLLEEEYQRFEDTYFIFKYLGNGKVKEMSTGKVLLIAHFGVEDFEFEDGNHTDYPSLLECKDYKTLQEELPSIIKFYKENPIFIYDELDFSIVRNLDDNFKLKYMKESDEYRRYMINKLIRLSLEEVSKLGKEITKHAIDMAYLDNQIYDLKKSK